MKVSDESAKKWLVIFTALAALLLTYAYFTAPQELSVMERNYLYPSEAQGLSQWSDQTFYGNIRIRDDRYGGGSLYGFDDWRLWDKDEETYLPITFDNYYIWERIDGQNVKVTGTLQPSSKFGGGQYLRVRTLAHWEE